MSTNNPFEVAKDISPDQKLRKYIIDAENSEMSTPEGKKVRASNIATRDQTQISDQIEPTVTDDQAYIYNETGEAKILNNYESCTDFGL